jgi:hypothetical protein
MKKILLPSLTVLLLTACQNNTPAPAATTTPTAVPAEQKIDIAQIKDANAKSKVLATELATLLADVNTASAATKGPKKAELEGLSATLNDFMAKQDMMAKAIEAADNAGGSAAASSSLNTAAVPTPTELKDYMESMERYSKDLVDLRGQFEAIKSGDSNKK